MITYGYAKEYQYTGDGTLMIRCRVPSIHGPYNQRDAQGKVIRNYIDDASLPWYPSILLPHLPNEGDVVAVATLDSAYNNMIIIGLTGASYYTGATNIGG